MDRERRFYGWGSPAEVEGHIAQVTTLEDVAQILMDIRLAETNLVSVDRNRIPGIYSIQYAATPPRQTFMRHLFITQEAVDRLQSESLSRYHAILDQYDHHTAIP
jgi:hypothetical protein